MNRREGLRLATERRMLLAVVLQTGGYVGLTACATVLWGVAGFCAMVCIVLVLIGQELVNFGP